LQPCNLTVNSFLISESMSLLSLVPFDDQAVTESESSASIRSTVKKVNLVPLAPQGNDRTHYSSQLKRDLAKVVSMCLTASAANSSPVLNSFAD
jgi:hypothetical protein